ncbi:MAG: biopolymer transporter ExbD [Spirochaetia bacterium]|nr:biopolymer transporter ExbD [Spirochaetia bacterium]
MKRFSEKYRHKAKPGEMLFADLTPLIDMIFLLLIFFLLTSMAIRPSIPVDLPESGQGVPSTNQEIIVSINTEGNIWVGDKETAFSELKEAIQRQLPNSSGLVTISADRKIPYGTIIRLADIASQAGAKQIGFMVETPGY